jgi:hypothetical protein
VRTTGSTGGFDFFFCRLRNRIHAATRAIIATAPAATPAPAAAPGETSPPDEVVGVEGIWVLVEAGVLLATDVEVEVVEKVKEDEIEGELEVWEIEADVYANHEEGRYFAWGRQVKCLVRWIGAVDDARSTDAACPKVGVRVEDYVCGRFID